MATDKVSLKELTKRFDLTVDNEPSWNHEDAMLSCALRIADATEAMAKNHLALQADRDSYKRWHELEEARRKRAERSAISLKGQLTRKKKEAAIAKYVLNMIRSRLESVTKELEPVSDFTGSRPHYLQGQKALLEELLEDIEGKKNKPVAADISV